MKKSVWALAGWVAATVIADPLPQGWFDQPFGTYTSGHEGATAYQDGVFSVTASGSNMGGTDEDGGRFVFQPTAGDFDLIVEAERLPWSVPDLSAWPRAGIMVRSSSDRDSAALAISRRRGATESENASTYRVERREARGTLYSAVFNGSLTTDWMRLRMTRRGTSVQVYSATEADPDTWTSCGTYAIQLSDSVLAGFYLCKTGSSAANTVTSRFRTPVLRDLVSVQKLAGSNVVTWVTDLPGITTNHTFEVQRKVDGRAFERVAQGLTVATYADTAVTDGKYYEYQVLAYKSPTTVTVGNSARIYAGADRPGQFTPLTNGLYAAYHTPVNAVDPVGVRLDPEVGPNWTNAVAGLGENDFSMTLTGTVRPETNGLYFFTAGVNKRLNLSVDGKPLMYVNAYSNHAQVSSSAPVWLEGGRSYSLVAEYVQSNATKALDLQWARQGDAAPAAVPLSIWEPAPPGWLTRDVGFLKGGATDYGVTTDLVTLAAAGGSVSNTEDAVRFLYRKTSNEFDFSARLQPSDASAVRAVSGLLVRGGLDGCDAQLGLFTRPAAGDTLELVLSRRPGIRSAATHRVVATALPASAPVELRVRREGMSTAFYVKNGATWSLLASEALSLPPALYVGAFAAGVDADTVCAADVDRLGWEEGTALLVRYPSDDTYVQSDAPGSTFYTSGALVCGRSREPLLKFDVADLANVSRATLRLYVSQYDDTQTQPVFIRTLNNTSWSEMNLTANTAPDGIMPPSPWVPTNDPSVVAFAQVPKLGNWLEVDVTAAVRAQAARTGKMALHIYTPSTVGWVLCFPSSNTADTTVRPHLACVRGAPAGVQAVTGPQERAVTVSWAALPDAASYCVEGADAPDGPFTEVASGVTATQLTETNLTAYARRHYRVSAVTPGGTTGSSGTVSAVPRLFTPLLPEADVFVEGGASQNLNLDYASNTTRGQYYVAKYTGLNDGGAREFFMRFNLASYSNALVRALLRLTVEPSSVTGPVLDFKSITNSVWDEAAVTWNNPPAAVILPTIWPVSVPANTVRATMTPVNTVTEADLTALAKAAAAGAGKLSLHAYNSANLNAIFYSKEYVTDAKRTRLYLLRDDPAAPLVSGEASGLRVSWGSYPGATAYHVERAAAATGAYVRVAQNLSGTSCLDATAPYGQAYRYRVVAVTPEEEAVSKTAVFEWFAQEVRYPKGDTYLDQNNPAVNFGAAKQLLVKKVSGPARESFFAFDVSGLEHAASVRFRVMGRVGSSTAFAPTRFVVAAGPLGDWNANAVTWNMPIPGTTVPRTVTDTVLADEAGRILYGYNTSNRLEVDVTAAARTAAAAGQPLTLRVYADTPNTHFLLDSDEATDAGTLRPSLIVSKPAFCQQVTAVPVVDVPSSDDFGLRLSWSPMGGAVTYSVYRLNPKTGEWTLLASDLQEPSFKDGKVYPDVEYTYQIVAETPDGANYSHAFTATMGRTFSRYATADTFVFSANKTMTYGTNSSMVLKCDSTSGTRESFLRFDLRNLPASLKEASLQVTVTGIAAFTADDALVFARFPDFEWVNNPAPDWAGFLGAQAGNTALPPAGTDPHEIRRYTNIQFANGESLAMDILPQLQAARAEGASHITLHVYLSDSNRAANMGIYTLEGGLLFSQMPQIVYRASDWSAKGAVLFLR